MQPMVAGERESLHGVRSPESVHGGDVPGAIANASYERQRRNPAVTEITKGPDRGHSLTIESGWREVAKRR